MRRQVVAVFLAMAMLLVVSFAAMAATKGDVNGVNGVEVGDAVTALRAVAGLTVSGLINSDADVNGDNRIGIHEAVYALQITSGVRVIVKGTVTPPSGTSASDLYATNFFSDSSVDNTGTFLMDQSGLLIAVNKATDNPVYISYPSTDVTPELNAKETAIAYILRILPFMSSQADPNLDALKQIIYTIPEVQALESAIQNTVNQYGWLDDTGFLAAYEAAVEAVAQAFGLMSWENGATATRKASGQPISLTQTNMLFTETSELIEGL